MRPSRVGAWVALLLALGACEDKAPAPPLSSLAPKPLPSVAPSVAVDGGDLELEALYQVVPAPVFGEELDDDLLRLRLEPLGRVRLGNQVLDPESEEGRRALRAAWGPEPGRKVLIDPSQSEDEAPLALVAALLAELDDAKAEVRLLHPSAKVAFPVRLRDEPAFRAWIDEPKVGKVRVIQRADGFEVQTNVGKLPGPDPNGPSVPVRGGQQDLTTLRNALAALKDRFSKALDVCFVPSFGTELAAIARALTANYEDMDEPIFDETCLVYPRPGPHGGR